MKNVVDTGEIDKHECDHRRCNSTCELGSDVQLFMLSNCLSMVSQRSTWFDSRFLHLVSLFIRSMCDALRHSRSRQLLVSIQFRPLTCHSFPGVSRRFFSLSYDVYQPSRSRKIGLSAIRSFSRVRCLWITPHQKICSTTRVAQWFSVVPPVSVSNHRGHTIVDTETIDSILTSEIALHENDVQRRS